MSKPDAKMSRREQILQALAQMLESSPGVRITTAALARQVGVSEAALYRHFPSKAKMYEGLIEFVEETIFSRVNTICGERIPCLEKCQRSLMVVLSFAEKNPGITRILTGDALTGENERLRVRIVQLFDRLETQIRQVLREAEIRESVRPVLQISTAANLLMATAEGRIAQFVRSEFKKSPTQGWEEQWSIMTRGFLREMPVSVS